MYSSCPDTGKTFIPKSSELPDFFILDNQRGVNHKYNYYYKMKVSDRNETNKYFSAISIHMKCFFQKYSFERGKFKALC